MRVSSLENKIVSFANMYLTDSIPSANENKSLNNNAKSLGFYLNLISKGNVARLAASGNIRSVILNFIKTFQFPNPRTEDNFNAVTDAGIEIAPLREIIKILFLFNQIRDYDIYLTKEEITNFIFYNRDVALSKKIDRVNVIRQIEQFRETKILPSNIVPQNERIWPQQERQITELLNIVKWSKFIRIDSERIYLDIPPKDDVEYKAELLDIITFNDFWAYEKGAKLSELKRSYFEYVDSKVDPDEVNFTYTSDIQCNNLEYNIQQIYFGAPGTGKSYGVDKLIATCYPNIKSKDNPFVFKTTIYSDYSYYNFIGNIMPTSKDGEIGYDFKAGVFTQALATAFQYKDKEVFLIVEEMSRGNIASIFGDVFQLLDRDENGNSEYSINNDLITQYFESKGLNVGTKISLPRNFHIIGTVNTSDQNVNVIDTAFKRRFEFVYVDVSPAIDGISFMNSFEFALEDKSFEWNKLYMALNELITTKLELSEDKQIGQFFIKFDNYIDEEHKLAAIQNKLLHYLWEDVQGAVISNHDSIFKEKYKTFSELYIDFGQHVNVFSEELNTLYDKKTI